MPEFTFDAKNAMLNALVPTQVSLHQAYDPLGGQELTGGDPAYARLVPTFSPAVGGVLVAIGVPYVFDVPAGTQVGFIGLWDAADTFLGMTPNGGGMPVPATLPNPADTVLLAPGHTFVSGDLAVGWNAPVLGDGGTVWSVTVISSVALSLGTPEDPSTPVSFPASFSGFLQRVLFQPFAAQGTFPVNSLSLNANIGT